MPRADLEANIVTTLQCGCFVASLAAGVLADKLGRRYSLFVAAVLAMCGTIMQAAALGHLAPFFIGRFIAGLGVGGCDERAILLRSHNHCQLMLCTGSASMIAPLYGK